jgi:hypothetical protein
MTETKDSGSPGSHPHSNRPNWQPGDDDADDLLGQKIADARRDGKSERHIAKLLGIPRMVVWRGKIFREIPPELFERLITARPTIGSKAILYIGRLCRGERPSPEMESCPHCGYVLRVRDKSVLRALDVMEQWLRDGGKHGGLIEMESTKRFDDHFGVCPTCRKNDGYINIGKGHWFYCAKDKVKWFVGSNLFSGWKHQTEDEQRAIYEALDFGTYTKID